MGAIPLAGLLLAPRKNGGGSERRRNLFGLFPWLKRTVKAPSFQFNLALPMLGVFWFVILAGLFGTKVSGRNAGPMVVWVLWLSSLILVLVPIGGRIWCTVCPLPLMGEWLQRSWLSRNPSRLVWPRWLSNAWPRVIFFLLLGTFSTTLVAVPPATSWMLIGLLTMAILVAFFPDQRLFCRVPLPDQQLHQPLLDRRPGHSAVGFSASMHRMHGEVLPYRQHQGMGMPLWTLHG